MSEKEKATKTTEKCQNKNVTGKRRRMRVINDIWSYILSKRIKLDRSVACPYDMKEVMGNRKFKEHQLVRKFSNGNDLNLTYFQKNGFDAPLLFESKEGLGKLSLLFFKFVFILLPHFMLFHKWKSS